MSGIALQLPTTRQHGDVSTPPDTTPAPCHPAKPTPECDVCARQRRVPCKPPNHRQHVAIDASTVRSYFDGPCPMFFDRRGRAAMTTAKGINDDEN